MWEVFSAQGKMIQTAMHKFSHNKIAQLQNEDKQNGIQLSKVFD